MHHILHNNNTTTSSNNNYNLSTTSCAANCTSTAIGLWLRDRDTGNTAINSPDLSECCPDSSSFRKHHITPTTLVNNTTTSTIAMQNKVKETKSAWSTGYSSTTMKNSDCSMIGEYIVGNNTPL